MPSSIDTIHGVGIGLRSKHYAYILEQLPQVAWFEALTDNYLNDGGLPLYHLEQVRKHYPITLHGVGLSLGSTDPLNQGYLKRLKTLCDLFQPTYVSDHLCWSSVAQVYGNDLFPLPYTEEAINHLVDRIGQVQAYLGRQILIENVSSYLSYEQDQMQEWAFLSEIAERADCHILLDVNNIYVSARNHAFDPTLYLSAIPWNRVKEMHLAGYEDMGTHLLDTHGAAVHAPVWELYRAVLQHRSDIPTLIEWDTDIPDFPVLADEARKAERLIAEARAS